MFGGQIRAAYPTVTLVGFKIAKNGDTDVESMRHQFQVASDAFTNGEYPLPTGLIQLNGSTDYVEAYFQCEENCTIHDNATRASIFWGMLVHPT